MSDSPMPDPTLLDSDDADLVPRDKLFEHHRRQLSAMLDGELPPDQAKFMLRRLQHDGELAACWERWQVCGDMLRGRHDVLLPADFSQRVAVAIAAGDTGGPDAASAANAGVAAASSAQPSPRWLRWGGGALAASVALVALMFARAPGGPGMADPTADAQAARVTSLVSPAATPASGGLTTTTSTTSTEALAAALPDAPSSRRGVGTPDGNATLAAAAVAVANVQRRTADRDRRSTRSQAQRAGVRLRGTEAAVPQLAVVSSAAPSALVDARAAAPAAMVVAGTLDPFTAQPVAPARAWPRAILPGYAAGGAFTASFGGAAASFHPFEPTTSLTEAERADADREQQDAASTPRGPR